MRARVQVSAYARSTSSLAHCACRLRSLPLLLAATVAALALNAPGAGARSTATSWEDAGRGYRAVRHAYRGNNEEARPRRRGGRSHAGGYQRGHRQARVGSTRTVTVRSGRGRPHAQKRAPRARQAMPQLAAADPTAAIVPLEQRSIVATHPLLPDAMFAAPDRELAGDPAPIVQAAAPRCKSAHPNAFALAVAGFARDFRVSEPAMVEGAWPHCRGARNPQSNWRLTSLGPTLPAHNPSTSPSLSGDSIRWVASAGCLASTLRAVLAQVAANFGPLIVNSTCRSPSHNRRVGGAPRSYHLTGNAVDFRVRSDFGGVLAFLSRLRSVGGLTHYGSGVFHIDTGPRRSWGPSSWGHRRIRVARRA